MSIVRGIANDTAWGKKLPRYNSAQHQKWLWDMKIYVRRKIPLASQIMANEIVDPRGENTDVPTGVESLLEQPLQEYSIMKTDFMMDDGPDEDDEDDEDVEFTGDAWQTLNTGSARRLSAIPPSTSEAQAGGGASEAEAPPADDGRTPSPSRLDRMRAIFRTPAPAPSPSQITTVGPTAGGAASSDSETKADAAEADGKTQDPDGAPLPSLAEWQAMKAASQAMQEQLTLLTKRDRSRHSRRRGWTSAKRWRDKITLLVQSRVLPSEWDRIDYDIRLSAYITANSALYDAIQDSLTYVNESLISHIRVGDGRAVWCRMVTLHIEVSAGAASHLLRKIMHVRFDQCSVGGKKACIRSYTHRLTKLNQRYAAANKDQGIPLHLMKARVLDLPEGYRNIVRRLEEEDAKRERDGHSPIDIPTLIARIEAWEVRERRFDTGLSSGKPSGGRARRVAGRRRGNFRYPSRRGSAHAIQDGYPGRGRGRGRGRGGRGRGRGRGRGGRGGRNKHGSKPSRPDRSNGSAAPTFSGICYNCGRRGHTAKYCPENGNRTYEQTHGHAKAAFKGKKPQSKQPSWKKKDKKAKHLGFHVEEVTPDDPDFWLSLGTYDIEDGCPEEESKEHGCVLEEIEGESAVANEIACGMYRTHRRKVQGATMLLDSGATGHYCSTSKGMKRVRPTHRTIRGAGSELLRGTAVGDLPGMNDCVLVRGLNRSLCSVGQLVDSHNVGIMFTKKGAFLVNRDAAQAHSKFRIASRNKSGLYQTMPTMLSHSLRDMHHDPTSGHSYRAQSIQHPAVERVKRLSREMVEGEDMVYQGVRKIARAGNVLRHECHLTKTKIPRWVTQAWTDNGTNAAMPRRNGSAVMSRRKKNFHAVKRRTRHAPGRAHAVAPASPNTDSWNAAEETIVDSSEKGLSTWEPPVTRLAPGAEISQRKPKVLDLCCGIGGFTTAAKMAGWECIASVDFCDALRPYWEHNFSHPFVKCDLMNPGQRDRLVSRFANNVDCVLLSAPCQAFSRAGRRKKDDPRAQVLYAGICTAVALDATLIVVENVVGMPTSRKNPVWPRDCVPLLEDAGYHIHEARSNCARCGIPQSRERIWMVCSKYERTGKLEETMANLRHQPKMPLTDWWPELRHVRVVPCHGGPAVLDASQRPHPAFRTNSFLDMDYSNYRAHPRDSAPAEDAVSLSWEQRLQLTGMPSDFKWPEMGVFCSRKCCAKKWRLPLISVVAGNIVVPQQALHVLANCELEANLSSKASHMEIQKPIDVAKMAGVIEPKIRHDAKDNCKLAILQPEHVYTYRDKSISNPVHRLHVRLGHASGQKLLQAFKRGHFPKEITEDWSKLSDSQLEARLNPLKWCAVCASCNSTHGPHASKLTKRERTDKINAVVHTDTMHRLFESLPGHNKYTQVFTDEATRMCVVEHLPNKTETTFGNMIQRVQSRMQVMHRSSQEAKKDPRLENGRPIMCFFTDNAGEIVGKAMRKRLAKAMIKLIMPASGAKPSNGLAERMNRTLLDISRRLLATHNMPLAFWELAMDYATFIYNLLPNKANPGEMSPHEMYYGEPPMEPHSRLRAFGCVAWVHMEQGSREHASKLDRTAQAYVFVGLPSWCRRSVLVYNPYTGKVVTRYARSISFEETRSGAELARRNPAIRKHEAMHGNKGPGRHVRSEFSRNSKGVLNSEGATLSPRIYEEDSEPLTVEDPTVTSDGGDTPMSPSPEDAHLDSWNNVYKAGTNETLQDIAEKLGLDPQELQNHNLHLSGCDEDGITPLDAELRTGTGLWIPDDTYDDDQSSSEDEDGEDMEVIAEEKVADPVDTSEGADATRDSSSEGDFSLAPPPILPSPSRELGPAYRTRARRGTAMSTVESPRIREEDTPIRPRMAARRKELALALTDIKCQVYTLLTDTAEDMILYTCDADGETHAAISSNESGQLPSPEKLLSEMVEGPEQVVALLTHDKPGDVSDPNSRRNQAVRMTDRCEALFECAYLTTLAPILEQACLVEGIENVPARSVVAPANYRAAIKDSFAEYWLRAIATEVANLTERGTFHWVWPRPSDRAIDTTWTFRTKARSDGLIDKLKARLCARGFRQIEGVSFIETTSPVTVMSAWRACVAEAAQPGWWCQLIDVKGAFLSADIDTRLLLKPFDGITPPQPGMQLLLDKCIYGLKQSSRRFHEKLKGKFVEMGLEVAKADPSLFTYTGMNGELLRVCVHVDDCFCSYNSQALYHSFRQELEEHFDLSTSDDSNVYLGILVSRYADGAIALSQQPYILDTLARFGMSDCKPATSPYRSGVKMTVSQRPTTEEGKKKMAQYPYRAVIGCLLWIANATRPDISHCVGQLARHGSNPGLEHWRGAMWCLKYLKGSLEKCLVYGRRRPGILPGVCHGYVDGSWADGDDRRSQSGYVFFSAGAPIVWRSIRQKCISLSSTESEVVAASEAAKEAVWLRRLFIKDLGYSPESVSHNDMGKITEEIAAGSYPTLIWCDNQSAIAISKNPTLRSATKHIALRYLYCRDACHEGIVRFSWVQSASNIADIFTKQTARPVFLKLRDQLVHDYKEPVNRTTYRPSKHSTSLHVARPDANHKGSNDAALEGDHTNQALSTQSIKLLEETACMMREEDSDLKRTSPQLEVCRCGLQCTCGQEHLSSSRSTPPVEGQRLVMTPQNQGDIDGWRVPSLEECRQPTKEHGKIRALIKHLWSSVTQLDEKVKAYRVLLKRSKKEELACQVTALKAQLARSRKSYAKALRVMTNEGIYYDSDEWSDESDDPDSGITAAAAAEITAAASAGVTAATQAADAAVANKSPSAAQQSTDWSDRQTQLMVPGPPYSETIVWDDSQTEFMPLDPESPAAAASMTSQHAAAQKVTAAAVDTQEGEEIVWQNQETMTLGQHSSPRNGTPQGGKALSPSSNDDQPIQPPQPKRHRADEG